jgi:hypothetical protein
MSSKFTLSWLKWEVQFCKDLTDKYKNAEHFEILIGLVGLKNVLRFIDLNYLKQHNVDCTISLAEEVEILENE